MSYSFAVGQQVVCIDDDFGDDGGPAVTEPVKDTVYTIREIHVADCCDIHRGNLFLLLVEIVNTVCPDCGGVGCCDEVDFYAPHFRPLVAQRREETMAALRRIATDCDADIAAALADEDDIPAPTHQTPERVQ